ncbi:MAG: 2-amino-4-hydroxy-6-hydroxymethyldihydropteridine diphosphokinase [Bacteroidetes bacterium]|nr:2-amino-4-hydroxy-6-hydroxymethyldihydropteridine diphosphokinase [Bacteroidota bacterium]
MDIAFLITGGNLGNRWENLSKAAALIEAHAGEIIMLSSVYETAAWGITEQPDFYNQVVSIETLLNPDELMQTLLEIEQMMGRQRGLRMGPRIIDIDILLMGSLIYSSPVVTIPHQRLAERRFVLTPLAEIAGDIIHPVYQKTIKDLLMDCNDELSVHKISSNN